MENQHIYDEIYEILKNFLDTDTMGLKRLRC